MGELSPLPLSATGFFNTPLVVSPFDGIVCGFAAALTRQLSSARLDGAGDGNTLWVNPPHVSPSLPTPPSTQASAQRPGVCGGNLPW